jgi:hypothetical protein
MPLLVVSLLIEDKQMAQTLEECVSRLEQMAEDGQQTWDLSKNDQEAIRLACRVLAVVQYLDEKESFIESGPCSAGGLCLVFNNHEVDAETHLIAFSEAGKEVKAELGET